MVGVSLRGEIQMPSDDKPPGFLEIAFLTYGVIGQQCAVSSTIQFLQGKDEVTTVGVQSDPVNVFVVATTMAGLMFLFYLRPKILGRIAGLSPLILTACFIALASSLWSDAKTLVFKRAAEHLCSILLALYVPARLGFDGAMRLTARAIGICAVLSLLAGLFVPRLGVMHSWGTYGRWKGIYAHKNPFAQAMGVGILLQYYLAVATHEKVWRLGVAALEIALVVLANSATVLGVIVFATSAYGIFLLATRGGAIRPLVAMVGAPLAAAFAIVLICVPELFHTLSGRDSTLTGRTELWAWVWRIIQQKPFFGHGFQEFWDSGDPLVGTIWSAIGWPAPNAHNGFLEVALDLGALGVLLVALVLVEALVRFVSLFSVPGALNQAGASLIFLAAVVIHSGTEAVLFRQEDIDWLMVAFFSFAAAQTLASARRPSARPLPNVLARARPLTA